MGNFSLIEYKDPTVNGRCISKGNMSSTTAGELKYTTHDIQIESFRKTHMEFESTSIINVSFTLNCVNNYKSLASDNHTNGDL